jgi:hypothetical protein
VVVGIEGKRFEQCGFEGPIRGRMLWLGSVVWKRPRRVGDCVGVSLDGLTSLDVVVRCQSHWPIRVGTRR